MMSSDSHKHDELRGDVLQIVEGILDSSSIPVLISLMDDRNERIALKSVEILLRYGADRVVPYLADTMGSMDRNRTYAIFPAGNEISRIRACFLFLPLTLLTMIPKYPRLP